MTAARARGAPITVLMPCRDQKPEFLAAAVASVRAQTSPGWKLLVVVAPETPGAVSGIVTAPGDPRIAVVMREGRGLGAALNTGMRRADTPFVCVLLSDDLLEPRAIEVLQRNIRLFPRVDVFHSSRRSIDAAGAACSPVWPSRRFALADFARTGSPVKHLMCWRRALGLAVGGMDESLGRHGCDDYDFPWTMAERGARFKPVRECLYLHRVHHEFARLTTHVPIASQVTILTAMFRKHGVSEPDISTYLQRALDGYLLDDVRSTDGGPPAVRASLACRGEVPDAAMRLLDAADDGVVPHDVLVLPRAGAEGLRLARRLCGVSDPDRLRELVLVRRGGSTDGCARLASASLVTRGDRVMVTACRAEAGAPAGWSRMLLNAVMAFAIERSATRVLTPSAAFVRRHAPDTAADGVERLHTGVARPRFTAERRGAWWCFDTAANRARVVMPMRVRELADLGPLVCVCHDVDGSGDGRTLARMLEVEARLGIATTYFVAPGPAGDALESIRRAGHAVGFRPRRTSPARPDGGVSGAAALRNRLAASWHRLRGRHATWTDLAAFRGRAGALTGYRLRGEDRRPSDGTLAARGLDWIALPGSMLPRGRPWLRRGVVSIPITHDDEDLRGGRTRWPAWRERALAASGRRHFVALALSDAGAEHWLDDYGELLTLLRGRAEIWTLDRVACHLVLTSAE
jgi:glycosyltransferase involved in cell wall biosynthesis